MKKKIENYDDEMLPEYDFTGGVRGKYAARIAMESQDYLDYLHIQEIKSKNEPFYSLAEVKKELGL